MSFISIKRLSTALLTSLTLIACQQSPDATEQPKANSNDDATSKSQTAATNNLPKSSSSPPRTSTLAPASEQSTSQSITILALGDSLTEGLGVAEKDSYPAQLEAALHSAGYANVKVINSGLSGETSTGLVNRLDWVLKTKPDITILTIGANDAMRGIGVSTIEQNIRTAIERLQAGGSTVILGGMQIYDNLGNDYVQSFYDIYPRIAKDTGVAFIPFFLDGVAADPKLNQNDAIHPTAEGYSRIVANNIMPVLEPTLTQVIQAKQQKLSEVPVPARTDRSSNSNTENQP